MNTQPTLNYYPLPNRGGKRMAYWLHGDPASKHLVLCVHGLTRQGRDFDVLAKAILDKASTRGESIRVISVDMVGRGMSDWLDDPIGYNYPEYTQDMVEFLTSLHQSQPYQTLDWVGTSMGGLIGIGVLGALGMEMLEIPVAASHFVINDIGPSLELSALERIASYVGQHIEGVGIFATEQDAAYAMWKVSSSFGPHSQEEWLALCNQQIKRCADGKYTFAYDPAIANIFKQITKESNEQAKVIAWQLYEHISARTLITRGLESDLLSQETALAMTKRGYQMPAPASLVEFSGVGHAPTFVAKEQHGIVVNFLWDEKV